MDSNQDDIDAFILEWVIRWGFAPVYREDVREFRREIPTRLTLHGVWYESYPVVCLWRL